jgi:transposase-like protein
MRIMCHAGEEAAVRREFREGAARIVRETNKPIAQVATDLGINPGILNRHSKGPASV